FGPLSYRIEAEYAAVTAWMDTPMRTPPAELRLRVRRPDRASIRAVTVEGDASWERADDETVRLIAPRGMLRVRVAS
ncbi:MAG: hypothetical protein V1772_00970, partial [Chloroflexota bacterium]